MPSTLSGLGLFVVFLTPGFLYNLQRRRRIPQRTLSPLFEVATLLTVSVVTDLVAVGIFSLIRLALPGHSPDPEELLANGSDYAFRQIGYLVTWGCGLLAFSCALAVLLARFGGNLKGPNFLTPLIEDESAWFHEFDSGPPGYETYVACDLADGTYLGGTLDWYSTELEETADRDLILAPPFTFTKDGSDNNLMGFDHVIISAGQIVRMYVSFVKPAPPAGGSDAPP